MSTQLNIEGLISENLSLKKALSLEAALEKVRNRAMKMECSADLQVAVAELFDQLGKLNLDVLRCGIGIMNRAKRTADVWVTTVSEPGSSMQVYGDESFDIHPLLHGAFEAWLLQTESYYVLKGQDLINYYKALGSTNFHLPESQLKLCEAGEYEQYYFASMFEAGGLFVFRETAFTEEAKSVIRRFAEVLNLTYKRFQAIQKAEQQAREAEATLNELRSTQAQLIQSEKMASLGEMTAGIAHEIQNPLNFVNNFSEINIELLAELKEELNKNDTEKILILANDLIENEKKISHHGKRADGIVKSMLQHSRSGAGQKEPTDINTLADEYLRLSYHGLRAKDKSFNAELITNFDNNAGKINIVPQDIGRVILNILNNAFQATIEKRTLLSDNYRPVVSVTTIRQKDKLVLTITDNGNGIPAKIRDKIFQPFFTTRRTGEGTGLGLSLSYDIITLAHGGEIKLKTTEGEGSEFIIELPLDRH